METAARLGVGLDYRYRPSRRTAGEAELHYYNEAIRNDPETAVDSPLFQPDADEHIPENRAVFTLGHRQRLDEHHRLYADAFIVSDDLVGSRLPRPRFVRRTGGSDDEDDDEVGERVAVARRGRGRGRGRVVGRGRGGGRFRVRAVAVRPRENPCTTLCAAKEQWLERLCGKTSESNVILARQG